MKGNIMEASWVRMVLRLYTSVSVPCLYFRDTHSIQWFLVTSILYGVVICVAKVTILLLYRRVFSPRRWSIFDLSIVVLIVTMVVFYIILCFTKIFVCTPRSKFYDPEIPGACFSFSAILNASGIFNTITDLQIFLLPVRAVWNLKLRVKKKILVILAFTFGLWYVTSDRILYLSHFSQRPGI